LFAGDLQLGVERRCTLLGGGNLRAELLAASLDVGALLEKAREGAGDAFASLGYRRRAHLRAGHLGLDGLRLLALGEQLRLEHAQVRLARLLLALPALHRAALEGLLALDLCRRRVELRLFVMKD